MDVSAGFSNQIWKSKWKDIKFETTATETKWILNYRPISILPVMYRSIPKPPMPPPPGQTPGHLTFLKNFGQIPRYVARIDGQMPHPLELQRGSNSPPFRHVTHETNEYKQNRLHLETSSAKFSATTDFLFSLSSLRTLNKGIVLDITI